MRKRQLKNYTLGGQIALNIVFILYALICLVPVLLVLAISFTPENTLVSEGYALIPSKLSFEAYRFVFGNTGQILRAYGITIMVTVIGTLLSLTLITLYAYPISRKELKYRKFFTFFLFFTMLFSGGLIPTYMIYTKLIHIKDTYAALVMPMLMGAWNVLVMKSFFQSSIPDEVIESVKIDGGGDWTVFLKIVLPLSLPGLATIALFVSVAYWNDWMMPLYYITDQKKYNLQYLLYSIMNNIQYLSEHASDVNQGGMGALQNIPSEGARMAMCIMALGPVVLVYPFLQKYFVKGLTVGAVKG